MTTEAAAAADAVVADERARLEAALVELEGRPQFRFRTIAGPAAVLERRTAEIGDETLAMRARLLRAMALVHEGKSEQGGRWAHEVLNWARQHDNAFLLARAHRVLSIFYRQIGDLSESLAHAVHCLANLSDDEPDTIRARHLTTLAVALDESGSIEEGDRRFREALALSTAGGDHELALAILNNMAYTAYENDDEAAALELVADLRAVQVRTGRQLGAIELDTIARIEMMGGSYAAVEHTLGFLLDGDQSTVESYEGDALAVCLLTLAEARRLARRYATAQEALDACVRLAADRGLDGIRAQAHEEQAKLYAAAGRFPEAYEEHRAFYTAATALQSAHRAAQARAVQAVFEAAEARRASERFREMAHRDALTGLYNRRYIDEQLPALIGEAAARHAPISVAILDLDHFKRINDTLSHSTGDTVLQHVAQLLGEATSGPMIVARLGGEEFLLIMPGAGAQEAAERCERLRLRIRAHAWAPITGALPVTTSIGVTTAPHGQATPSALLSLADRNLYAAKREGRNRVIVDR